MKRTLSLILLSAGITNGLAQTNLPMVNPAFDFTTLPSGSTTNTGYTSAAGAGVAFVPVPSGSSSDTTANALGWRKVGSASVGFQRLNGVWKGIAPAGGVGYA